MQCSAVQYSTVHCALYIVHYTVQYTVHSQCITVQVEADTVMGGVQQLYRNNVTEFPLVINTLKRSRHVGTAVQFSYCTRAPSCAAVLSLYNYYDQS